MSSTLYIKNMVCDRCKMVVKQLLEASGVPTVSVQLGEVQTAAPISAEQLAALDRQLEQYGFERIDDRKGWLLEQIKALVIEVIHQQEKLEMTVNWSDFMAKKLGYDYHYISSFFSSIAGVTLEQYIIQQRVEKAKEYLFYNELSVKEIAYRLGYSSVAHLSAQFKKVTGLTPTEFKAGRGVHAPRKPLDQV